MLFYNIFGKLFQGTRITQYFSVIIVSIGVAITRAFVSWTSPVIPKLKSEDSPLGRPLTSEESSWVVSCFILSALPTALVYSKVMGNLSRKNVLLICSLFFFFPWFFIIFANDVIYIYIGRCVSGLGVGYTVISVTMYIAEVSDPDIRGRLGTSFGILKLIGSTLILAIGPYVSFVVISIICAILPLVYFLLLFIIPESPHFLIRNNRIHEAEEAIKYLSGTENSEIINKKLEEISKFVQSKEKPLTIMEALSNRLYRKTLLIAMGILCLEHFGGSLALTSYFETIISKSQSIISPELSSIVFGLIQLPSAVVSAYAVDKLGRKVIIYIGATGCIISLIAEGIYFYLDEENHNVDAISWLPTTGIAIYIIMHSLIISVPNIIIGEIFPDRMKNVATTFYIFVGSAAVFIVQKTFEPIANSWGMYTAFWIYAFFNMTLIIFTYIFLPETKGKTLSEIESKMYFNN